MEIPPWLYIAIASGIVVLIVLGVLQVIWIRGKMDTIENNSYKTELDLRKRVGIDVDIQNRLQVYGLVMNVGATSTMNKSPLFDMIKQYALPKTFNIPHTCGSEVKSLNTVAKSAAFLVVAHNGSAAQLVDDVVSGRTRYIVMNKKLMLIDFDASPSYDRMIEVAKQSDTKNVELQKLRSCKVFFLYRVSGSDMEINDKSMKNCISNVRTFWGSDTYTDDKVGIIDMASITGATPSTKEVPLHVLGYRLL